MSKTQSGLCGIDEKIWKFVVLFASFYINFSVDGYNFVFGYLKLEIEKQYPHIGKQWIALIGSLVPGLYCILSPLAPKIADKIGMRLTIIIAAGLQLSGFALAFFNPFKSNYYADLLALGVFQGVGSALLLTNSISSITNRFEKKGKALATGLVTAGSPFGAIFYGSLFKTFLEATSFGWRGTLIFFAGLAAMNILCGIVFTPPPAEESKQIEPKLWNYRFFGLLIMTSLFITGYYVTPLLIPGQARNPKYGVSEGVANNIILVWGISNGIGRILVGFMSDISYNLDHKKPYLTSFTIITLCTIICAAAMFVFPHVMIYGNVSFLLLQIVYGFFVAGGISLRSVILKELIPGSVSNPLAWMYFSDGLFVVIGFCLSAYVDTIAPVWAYSFAGICFASAVVFMFTLLSRYLAAYDRIRRDKTRNQAEEEANKHEIKELLERQNVDATTA
ncbi:hypothetical protein I4U23_016995 [Adineta vaga]|nr:hypothetical protein I4U23_016995 [Adineta vaga]